MNSHAVALDVSRDRPGRAVVVTHSGRAELRVTAGAEGLVSLMRRYADDDADAFDELYRRLAPRLRSVIASLAGTNAAIDDLLQVTMMRAHLARGRFVAPSPDAEGAVVAWYATIARNVAFASLKGAGRRLVPTDVRDLGEVADASDPEAEHIERQGEHDIMRRVQEALGELPAAQRELIELHKLQGMSFGEIARRLGVRETAARVRAHRAYKALARVLGFGSGGSSA